jgi:4'-phosphopantetheinyl transferase
MPISLIEHLNSDCTWALWNITETSETLKSWCILADEDALSLQKISHPSKLAESMACRLALQKIIENWNEKYQGIYKDIYNKPHLIDLPYHISISHTQGYGIAIVHRKKTVGIDMEPVREKVKNIAVKFLSPTEMEHNQEDTHKLTILWAAKEALYKLHGKRKLIFNQNIEILPFFLQENGNLEGSIESMDMGKKCYTVYYQKLESYYIVYAF